MPLFQPFFYVEVGVCATPTEAETYEEAVRKARAAIDFDELLAQRTVADPAVKYVQFVEGENEIMVDRLDAEGEPIEEETKFFIWGDIHEELVDVTGLDIREIRRKINE